MIILTIRSDKPEAEIGLYKGQKQIAYQTWQAHRQLAETIHVKLLELLQDQALDWTNLEAVVGFKGPGSFTGLRIGLTVANSLADGLTVPIVGCGGSNWQLGGIKRLLDGQNDRMILPDYGADPHITVQRH
ncbi:MAG: hypothetical protein ABI221_02255 [Candidatus Saccharimonadales bacterium]